MAKKTDDMVIWKEPNIGFLPKEIQKDELSIYLRMLIAKVKEEHAMFQYKKELKDYAVDIMSIIALARKNGYKITNIREPGNTTTPTEPVSSIIKTNTGKEIDLSKIVDG